MNILMCQVFGTKRVTLVPLEDPVVARRRRGLFSSITPGGDDWSSIRSFTLVLAAGDALFLPAGWWHYVEALEPSITVSINCFAWT
jgi:hypothetical protein